MTIQEINDAIEIALEELVILKANLEEAEASVGVSDKFVILNAIQTAFEAETITGKEALYKLELLGL